MFERFTKAAREAVRLAISDAGALGAATVGTEHLLLALAQDDTGPTGLVLRDHGITPDRVRAALAASGAAARTAESDAAALAALGIDLDAVRAAAEHAFGRGALDVPRRRWRPTRRRSTSRFGDGAKKALELSLREAIRLGDRQIGSEHLLLGVLRESRGRGAHLVTDLGVDPEVLRRHVEEASRRAA